MEMNMKIKRCMPCRNFQAHRKSGTGPLVEDRKYQLIVQKHSENFLVSYQTYVAERDSEDKAKAISVLTQRISSALQKVLTVRKSKRDGP